MSEGEWAGKVVLVELEVPPSVPGPNPGVMDLPEMKKFPQRKSSLYRILVSRLQKIKSEYRQKFPVNSVIHTSKQGRMSASINPFRGTMYHNPQSPSMYTVPIFWVVGIKRTMMNRDGRGSLFLYKKKKKRPCADGREQTF